MKKKTVLIIVTIVICLIAIRLSYNKNKKIIIDWDKSFIDYGSIELTVTATGTLNALTSVDVGTQVSGIISKLMVDFNSIVKENQVVALLDTTYLSAAVYDSKANVHKAKVQMEQLKREYDRINQLFTQKVVAQVEYDVALANYETAESNFRSSKAQLNRAEINLSYATIRAPISGIVTARKVNVGQTVAASFNTPTLFTIANDLTKMQVEASVDEADIGMVKVGQSVTFSVSAFPDDVFVGTVNQLRLQPTITQNVVNYTVIIDAPNTDLKLLPGMTADIIINIERHEKIKRVLSKALIFSPTPEQLPAIISYFPDSIQKRYETQKEKFKLLPMREKISKNESKLWLLENNIIRIVYVKTGLSDGKYTEVINNNVSFGETIVLGIHNQNLGSSQKRSMLMPQKPK